MSPSPPEPAIQHAARLLAEGRPAEAVEHLAALVAEAPVYAAAHVLHATALEAAGQTEAALDAWGRAAALVPRSPLVRRERARLLTAQAPTAHPEGDALPPAVPAEDAPEPTSGPVDEAPAQPADADPDVVEAADVPNQTVALGPRREPEAVDLLAPETLDEEPTQSAEPEAPEEADGWSVVAEEEADRPDPADPALIAPEDAPADPVFSVADELDSLIAQLEDAPRIRPDPAFSGPSVSFERDDTDEVASETLAKIYEAQKQYAEAAAVYEKLAAREPARAGELMQRAAEMRERA